MARQFFLQIVDDTLKKLFFKLGVTVGHHPGYFLIVPALLTALCASGFQRMNYNYDPEYLISPSYGMAKEERAVMEEYFPVNYNYFQPQRMSRVGKFGRVIITSPHGGTLLRTAIWEQILEVDSLVRRIRVEQEGDELNYGELCARWGGVCRADNILNLAALMPQIETGEFNLTHPITFDPYTFEQYTLPAHMGGFTVSDIGVVEKIEALSMTYFLDVTEEWHVDIGNLWERKFLSALQDAESDFPDIKISKFVSNTPAWEMEAAKDSVTPTLLINVSVMVVFCLFAASMSDVVRSKPFIGFIGLFTAINATIAGFGFACYLGVEFIALCYAAPFLLLGIGIDDTFVMLSAWLRSPAHASVPERMGHCYSDAAVSVTVTSLTNILSFYAGVITPFPCVRIFCLYTGTAVVFIYIWQLSFFGACLAMAGYREKRNKSFFNMTATPKSQSLNRGLVYRLFFTGGINPADPYNPLDNKDHAGMVFLRDKLGYALNLKWVKSLVLIMFTAYIVVAIWGITNIKEGLDKRNIVKFDSYSIDFYNEDDKYFNEYRYPINVMLTGKDINYSEKRTQDRIEKLMQTFENSTYIAETMSQSWLRDFLGFVERNKGFYTDIDFNIETEHEFVKTLKSFYLSDPASPFNLDVNFDDNGERISSSRFLLMGLFINDSIKESEMVRELRKICQEFSTDDFKVTVFHPYFIYIDQYLEIKPQTIQSVLVTAGFMMVISFIMIPNPICSLWVAFSIMSIVAGVLGYMTWWGVNLDGVALINLIMCIGFSVDYSAHICYHYMSVEDRSPDKKISASLYALGLPIIQGAISTILGVIGLAFAPSYLFITFFKMIFLVILLGALHGLILLPVLLSLFGPGSCEKKSSGQSTISTPSTTVSLHSSRIPSCYTVNLGFGTPGEYRKTDPLRYHGDFQIRQHTSRCPSAPQEFRPHKSSEFDPDKMSFVTRITTEGARSETRLTPVLESDENHDGVFTQMAVIGGLNQNGNIADHKKICRSKSHRPRTQTLNDKALHKEKNLKPPLRKYNSFPYHMFMNEGGYSSDESIKSAFQDEK